MLRLLQVVLKLAHQVWAGVSLGVGVGVGASVMGVSRAKGGKTKSEAFIFLECYVCWVWTTR